MPPVPAKLAEQPAYEIDYVGRLSMATKSFETMGAINTLRVFGELAGLSPTMQQSLQNIEPDKLFRQIWYANSASMNALKDPKQLEAERAEEAEAMQRQMAMAQVPAMADAAQKLSTPVPENSIVGKATDNLQEVPEGLLE